METPGKNQLNGKKILIANVPFDGHFNPLTGLAVTLKEAGYDVRWYTGSIYESKIKSMGIPYFPFRKALEINSGNLDVLFPERNKISNKLKKLNFDIINIFVLRSVEFLEDIEAIREVFPFDLMISDTGFTGIPLIKEKLGVPVIAVSVFPLTETSRDLAPYGFGLTPDNTFTGRIKQAALRWFAHNVIFKKSDDLMNGILKAHNISSDGAGLFDLAIRKSNLLFQSGTPGFEYYRSDMSSNIRFVGPLLPYTSKKDKAAWYHHKLISYEKVILVTQGTVEKDVNKIVIPTLDAFKDTNRLVVVTTGGSSTEELKRIYPHDNIIIEDFIPFADVMPYSDVFVTNGGYGGVLLGIQNELPLVVAGIHEGKNEINARVGYFKLGINLNSEVPTAKQIKTSVEKVLQDPGFKTNIVTLSKEFKKHNPHKLVVRYVGEVLGVNTYPERQTYREVTY